MIVVSSDEKKPFAGRGVGVHSDNWDTGSDGAVNIVFQQIWIGNRDEDASGFALHRLLKCLLLSFGIIGIRPSEF